jgi:hypothetical protein
MNSNLLVSFIKYLENDNLSNEDIKTYVNTNKIIFNFEILKIIKNSKYSSFSKYFKDNRANFDYIFTENFFLLI